MNRAEDSSVPLHLDRLTWETGRCLTRIVHDVPPSAISPCTDPVRHTTVASTTTHSRNMLMLMRSHSPIHGVGRFVCKRGASTRNPALVLIWVPQHDEPEIRKAFEQTLAVRALSAQARDLADRFFFETLVRVHRAGEGAPFTGLKPAGRDLGPAIPAADEAVRVGSVELVGHLLTAAIQERLRQQFGEVIATKTFEPMMSRRVARTSRRTWSSFIS